MTLEADIFYMDLALDLALKGLGTTSPNPLVGCVVAREGRVVGRGFHERPGGPHAEVAALDEAGDSAHGSTLYVNLEPCSHFGRTPPCAGAIVKAGVKRVVAAMEDPNPLVAGRGFALLKDAGVEVSTGLGSGRARLINEPFTLSVIKRRSFVRLKLAATLDGHIATATGDSRWVTSRESREEVHRLRKRCGVVAVGVQTALSDDPMLDARLPGEPPSPTLRVILDGNLRIAKTLKMLSPVEAPYTLVFCGERADAVRAEELAALGATVQRVGSLDDGMLDLKEVLEKLYSIGKMEVLVEGGSQTARSFLDQRLVDRCYFFYSPGLLGGSDAVPMVGGKSPARISDAVRLKGVEVGRFGEDISVTGVPVWPGEED